MATVAVVLYFPTKGAPTTTLTLVAPEQPYSMRQPVKRNTVITSDGGTVTVYAQAATQYHYSMDMRIPNSTMLDNFIAFFDTVVDGMVKTFEMDDTEGNAVTACRFSHDTLEGRLTLLKKDALYRIKIGIFSAP